MQHVLRCWERQSDRSEYKKTLRLRPGPRWGSLQRSRKPPSWWGGAGCRLPKNPIPRSRPFVPRLSYPTPRLVPTPLDPSLTWALVYNYSSTSSRPLFDSHSTAVRPRCNHSTTYVTTVSLS